MNAPAGKVLVTGASGFIGRRLCGHFHRLGRPVIAGMRNPEKTGGLPSGIESRTIPDLEDSAANWVDALRNVESVIHLVTPSYVMNDDRTAVCQKINVDGTQRLLHACTAHQVQDFIYMSSIKAVGEGNTGPDAEPYTETTRCEPQDEYGRSKLAAEQMIQDVAPTIGLSWKILRPPLVYGPGCAGNLVKLVRLLKRGVPLPLGQLQNARSMLFVENLCDAVTALLDRRDVRGIFHVADGTPVSTTELLTHIAEALDRPPRLFAVPAAILRLAGRASGRAAEVSRLVGSLVVGTDKIRSTTGWQPSVAIAEGIRTTVRSLDATHEMSASEPARSSRPAA